MNVKLTHGTIKSGDLRACGCSSYCTNAKIEEGRKCLLLEILWLITGIARFRSSVFFKFGFTLNLPWGAIRH
jgi:hypothetical protein